MEPSGSYTPVSPDLSAVSYYPDQPSASYYSQPQHYQPPLPNQPLPPPFYPRDDPLAESAFQTGMPASARTQRLKVEDPDWHPPPASGHPGSFQQFAPPKEEIKLAPGEAEGIVVRTKFPVARIKRIVQADEDVGKVAQVTPVVVAKALEIFMISLALKSADEARARGSRKVTGAHLKEVVQKDDQFDFLKDIVAKIADAPASKKEKEEDSDDGTDGPSTGKKKKPATRRRRKEREES